MERRIHKTTNPEDPYLGSGVLFSKALVKHGKENFKKEVLFIFDNPEEMLSKERELVVVDPEKTYNLDRGGWPGWGSRDPEVFRLQQKAASVKGLDALRKKLEEDPSLKFRMNEKTQASIKKRLEEDPEWAESYRAKIIAAAKIGRERASSPEAQAKLLQSLRDSGHQIGEKNSRFGTCLVNKEGIVISIPRSDLEDYLSQGYFRGHNPPKEDNRSYLWVHKDGQNKRIDCTQLEEHLNMGYSSGLSIKLCWVQKDGELIHISVSELGSHLKQGFHRTTAPKLPRGKKKCDPKNYLGSKNTQFGTCWINKNGQDKKIKKEQLEEFEAQGFSKGRAEKVHFQKN